MNVADVKTIILNAIKAKENSDNFSFAEMLQREIEGFVLKITNVMGKHVDNLSTRKLVPPEIEEEANKLIQCFSL